MNYSFDSTKVKHQMYSWISQWFDENAMNRKAIVGISGGRDSIVVAALLVKALGKDRVIGVILPYKYSDNVDCTVKLLEYLDMEFHVVYIRRAYNDLLNEVREEVGPLSAAAEAMMQERLRMTALSGIVSSKKGIFVNTSNLSEDWLGYYTRYGDISPLLNFTITEVGEIAKVLGLPDKFIDPLPLDGLWGQIHEDSLGFSYEVLDDYIRLGKEPDPEIKKKIDHLHEVTHIRRAEVTSFEYER